MGQCNSHDKKSFHNNGKRTVSTAFRSQEFTGSSSPTSPIPIGSPRLNLAPLKEEHLRKLSVAEPSSPTSPTNSYSMWRLSLMSRDSPVSVPNLSPRSLCSVSTRTTTSVVKSVSLTGKSMVNQYMTIRKIGEGNYSKVKLVENQEDGRHYAMKVFKRTQFFRGNQTRVQRASFQQEIAILKKINHPNIVRLHEVIDDPTKDKLYMVLEYVEQGPILTLNEDGEAEEGPLAPEKIRRYLEDLLTGLRYLHNQKILHRDIKPANLLVDAEGNLKLSDFGVSQVYEDSDVLKGTEGTPAFWAPEECKNDKFSGRAADIWAVGVTLYAMAFGHLPFRGNSLFEMYNDIVEADPDFPEEADPELVDLISNLLQEDPEDRLDIGGIIKHPWFNQGREREYKFPSGDSIAEFVTQEEVENAINNRRHVTKAKMPITSRARASSNASDFSETSLADLSSMEDPLDRSVYSDDLMDLIEHLPGMPSSMCA